MNKSQARRLFDKLRDSLLNAEATVIEIIREKAWEPLGYDTFEAAWNAELKGIRLATDALKAHVLWAMFDDGMSDEGIAEATGGAIRPSAAKSARTLHRQGVPAETVRYSQVTKPQHPQIHAQVAAYLHLRFNPAELVAMRNLVESDGETTLEEFAVGMLRSWSRDAGRAAS